MKKNRFGIHIRIAIVLEIAFCVNSYMTGFNWFVSWDQYSTWAEIRNSDKSLYAGADGNLSYYSWISGVLKVYDYYCCMEYTFTN